MSEDSLRVFYNIVFDDVFKNKKRREVFTDSLENALNKAVSCFEAPEHSVDSNKDQTFYHYEAGIVCFANYEGKFPQVVFMGDKSREQDIFSVGRLLSCVLRVMQVHDIKPSSVWQVHKGKDLRVSDLVAVNVYGHRGNMRACINDYALPLHHINGRIVRASDAVIKRLEDRIRVDLMAGTDDNKIIEIETSVNPVWKRKNGSYEPFFSEEQDAYVLRRQSFTVSDVPRSEPSPRSDGAQFP